MSKPGEKALQAMKELDKTVAVFKKPAVPKTKKEKKIILNEETYLEVCNYVTFTLAMPFCNPYS